MKNLLTILISIPILGLIIAGLIQESKAPENQPERKGAAQVIQPPKKEQKKSEQMEDILKLASDLENKQLIDQALETYQQAGIKFPSDPLSTQLAIELLIKNHRNEEAKQKGEEGLQKFPNNKRIETALIHTAIRLGNSDEVLEKTKETNEPELGYYRALALIGKNDLNAAKEELAERIGTDSNWKQQEVGLLDSIERYDREKEAPESYLDALLAKTLNTIQEQELAKQFAKKAVETSPDYRDARILLGFSHFSLGEYLEAEIQFLKGYELDPTKAETQYFLGSTYLHLGKPDQSIKYLQYALKNNFSKRDTIYNLLAENYIQKEEYALAEYYLKMRFEQKVTNVEEYIRPIWLDLEKLKQPDKARLLAEDARRKFPNEAVSFNLLAWVEIVDENYNLAISYLNQAQALDSGVTATYLNLGRAFEAKGDKEKAKEYYRSAAEMDPSGDEGKEAQDRLNQLLP